MAQLADFYPYLLPMVPGCPDILADQHLRDICIDFCGKSLVAQQPHDPLSVRANVAAYDFDPPAETQVQLVIKAWYLRNELKVITPNSLQVRPEMFNPRFSGADLGGSVPTKMIQLDGTSFTLDPAPQDDAANAVTLLIAVKPSRTATEVPQLLLEDYAYEIGRGAAARLMTLPGQPFTNPQLASAYLSEYLAARNAALLRANKSFGRSAQRVDLSNLL
jgi:hypothetical protein